MTDNYPTGTEIKSRVDEDDKNCQIFLDKMVGSSEYRQELKEACNKVADNLIERLSGELDDR